MPENGGSPRGINDLQVFVTDAAKRASSGQGEGQAADGRLVAKIPTSQERHPVTRSVPNSHDEFDSGQERAEWLEVSPKS